MASIRRNASHASITLKRTAQGYHLLQTLPSTYLANDTGNSARRKSPAIEDDPLSSSDDSSKSAADDKGGSNALRSTADGWREPPMRITKAEEGKHPLKADMGGSSGTAFRDPSKMNLSSPPQRRSNRTQNGKGSPKRSREEVEADREDNLLDEFGLIPLSQGQSKSKKMRVYGPAVNIHGSGNIGRTQHSSKKSPSRVKKGDKGGFRTPNLEAIEEKRK